MPPSTPRPPLFRRVACAASLVVLLLGGCAGQRVAAPARPPQPSAATTAPAAPAPVAATKAPRKIAGDRDRVAILVPLSGPSAALGRAMLDAAQMALFDIADDRFELIPRDTKGTSEGAVAAATSALDDGARLIIGPLLQTEVEAVRPMAKTAGVPIIAFTTATQLAGDGTFLLSFLPRQQVTRVVDFAKEKGLTRIAVLAPNSAYGDLMVDALRVSVGAAPGLTIVRTETYDPAAADISPQVRRLTDFDKRKALLAQQRQALEAATDDASKDELKKLQGHEASTELDFDALFLPEGGTKLKQIAPVLGYFDVDPTKVKLLGTGLWDEPGTGSEPLLIGGWYAAPAPEARAEFERSFQALYKRRAPRLATLGYDAAALAAVLARPGEHPPFSIPAIVNPVGFAGVDGLFRFRADGLPQRGLAVLEVQRGGPVQVSPAPDSFANTAF